MIVRLIRHEIAGIVTEVGANAASHFKVGDRAGVGCFVRACRDCELCKVGDDQYCARCVFTYVRFFRSFSYIPQLNRMVWYSGICGCCRRARHFKISLRVMHLASGLKF